MSYRCQQLNETLPLANLSGLTKTRPACRRLEGGGEVCHRLRSQALEASGSKTARGLMFLRGTNRHSRCSIS